ncbi:MAG: fluoride efflux transporter CrcB [Gammaproteobacteria bacterium]|nr:MAG: fluoride efflux transporter CrcB [Gammaproteobacteria bacterium]
MQQLLAIAGGGALGAVLRFAIASNIYRWLGRDFPYGILVVNVIGSLLMGLLFALIVERGVLPVEWRGALMIGFLGALTTFSTFSMETIILLESGEPAKAGLNILLSVVLCLGVTWFGLVFGRQL